MNKRLIFSAAAVLILLTSVLSCKTEQPEPLKIQPPEIAQSTPAPEKEKKPEALNIDWSGTGWIAVLPEDKPDTVKQTFPGYRAVYFAEDGKLLLINFNGASGGKWSVSGNSLIIASGNEKYPLTGTFTACKGKEENTLLLVCSDTGTEKTIKLIPRKINIDLIENHWIPKWLNGGSKVPWPLNREIHLMILPDAAGKPGILGFGGENRFHGSLVLTDEKFIPGPIAITRRYGPASEFENLYVKRLSETDRYVQFGDDLFLFSATVPTVFFRVRLFD